MNSIRWVEISAQDLRYALRQLRRSHVFAAVVVATLGLGIGGTTAVFSVAQAVLLDPLPYEQPEALVRVYQQEPDNPATRHYLSGAQFRVVRDHASSLDSVAALDTYSETGLDLVKDGHAQRLRVLKVTSDYFRTLGSRTLRGPGFDIDDENGAPRVVLSDSLWRTRFQSDASVIGAAVQLSGVPHEVVGIAAPGFDDPIVGAVDAWIPMNLVGNTSEQNYSLTARPAATWGDRRAGRSGVRRPQPVDETALARRTPERRRCGSAQGRSRGNFARSAASSADRRGTRSPA